MAYLKIEDFYRESDGANWGMALERIMSGTTARKYGSTVLLGNREYIITGTLHVVRPLTLQGEHSKIYLSSIADNSFDIPSLRFVTSTGPGIITHYPSDSNGAATYGDGNDTNCAGTLTLRNLVLRGPGKTVGLHNHGINAHLPVFLENVGIGHFGGIGVKMHASFQSVENRGNVNGSRLQNVRITDCGGIGVSIQGGDANNIICDKVNVDNCAASWINGLSGANVSQIADQCLIGSIFIVAETGGQHNGGSPFYGHSSGGSLWLTPYVEGAGFVDADISGPNFVVGGACSLPPSGAYIGGTSAGLSVNSLIQVSNPNVAAPNTVIGIVGDGALGDVAFGYRDSATDGGGRMRLRHFYGNDDSWGWQDTNSSTLIGMRHSGIVNRRRGRNRWQAIRGFSIQNNNSIENRLLTHTIAGIPLKMEAIGQRQLIQSMSFSPGQQVLVQTVGTHFFSQSQRIFIEGVGVTTGTSPINNDDYYIISSIVNSGSFRLFNTNGDSTNTALYSASSGEVVIMTATGYATSVTGISGAFAVGDTLINPTPSGSISSWRCIATGTNPVFVQSFSGSGGSASTSSFALGSGYIAGAQSQTPWDTTAVLFDGIADWASSSYNNDIWGSGSNLEWSYSWWLRKNGVGTWQPLSQTILARWFNNTRNVFRVLGDQTAGRMGFFISVSPTDVGSNYGQLIVPPSDDQWHHYVMCYSGTTGVSSLELSQSNLQVYVDGIQQSLTFVGNLPATSTLPPTPPALTLGRGESVQSLYFSSGAMDEVAYFNRRLTSSDVADVYNAGIPIDLRTVISVSSSLKAYWGMGEGHTANSIPNLVSGSAMFLMNDSGSVPTGATGSIENRYTTDTPGP